MTRTRFLPRLLLGWALALLLCHAGAQALVPVPPLTAHVTDQIGLLDARQRATLEAVLAEYEQRSGSQIAVLLMASTAPEAIEQYSIRVADAWRLGRKGIDDGAILIVARDNPPALRRLRIEAGRGVQGSLTDAQSKRVLQDVIAPYFQRNDFYGGLTAGVTALTALLDQEHLPAPAASPATPDDGFGALLPLLFFAFLVILSIASRARGGRNALSRNGWGTAAGVILGSMIERGGRGGGGGFGGGGFSGGGGGFDGGGASGDW